MFVCCSVSCLCSWCLCSSSSLLGVLVGVLFCVGVLVLGVLCLSRCLCGSGFSLCRCSSLLM